MALAAAPAAAEPVQYRAFLEAMVAADAGADEQASRRFAALLAAEPQSLLIAERALDHAMEAGDWPLALGAARRLEAADKLPPIRRLLLAAEALRTRDWPAAATQIERIERDDVLTLMVPILRAWRAYGAGEADPAAHLAAMESGPVSGYAVEHRALLELAQGKADAAQYLALDPASGLRAQHLRIVAAAEFAARGDRATALSLVSGDQPAMAAARAAIEAGRALPYRVDSAAEGLAEFLARAAIDFSQQEQAREGVILARLAAYLAPDSSQPRLIAAELLSEREPGAAARILADVRGDDPFAGAVREIRLQHLAASGQSAAAIAEVRARIEKGSRDPADWIQLGQLLNEEGRHKEAAEAFGRAHGLWRAGSHPTIPEWTIWLMRGGALEQAGDWPEARAALQQAYRLAPEEPLVLNYLGYAQLDRGERIEESERLIREALRRAPDNAAIIDSLGWALFKRGRVDEAIPVLERAVQGAPADPEINEHLGDAYYAAGRRVEARFAWRAALVHAEDEAPERLRRKIERGLDTGLARR